MVTPLPRLHKRRNQHTKINKLKIKNTSVAPEDSTAKKERKPPQQQQQRRFPSELQKEIMPKHVAIIMDGNSRWARSRGLPTSMGHHAGYNALKDIVQLSYEWGIKAVTVFAFSSENWRRPKVEIDFLMMLFENVLKENLKDFLKEDVRLCIIGETTKLPVTLQKLAKEVTESTKNNSKLDLVVAVSYSGRLDIVQACQRIAGKVKEGILEPEDIDEAMFEEELETNCISEFPNPDLLIRTSGELRLSNFLLWQSAYSELYFADVLWPDFKEADYVQALASFQRRQRRFGQRIN